MQNQFKPQKDYSTQETGFQLVMNFDCGIYIAKDHPVRLLNAVMERMSYSKLMAEYSRLGRIEYSPKILLKILVYGYMCGLFTSRVLEACCRENVCFMYLLEGQRAPDHNTINRFRKNVLSTKAGQDILRQLVQLLRESGLLSFDAAFIDGTKIEANANKYSFVWKKGTIKKMEKLHERMRVELPEKLKSLGMKFHMPEKIAVRHLKKVYKRLRAKAKAERVEFVHGSGKRKTVLQRVSEQVEVWIKKLQRNGQEIHICGERNSYSKTDHDATFMHMKEDSMNNGQLKAGYNVNVATCNEFIVGSYVSSNRNDTPTLIPLMTQLREMYKESTIGSVVVDSGYESEENYCWFEAHPETELYVKPINHEMRKHKKYKTDISRRENMAYDSASDTYTCAGGKQLSQTGEKHSRSALGVRLTTTVYECKECDGCPLKEKCIRGCGSKQPLKDRHKALYVSKRFARQREAMEQKINTYKGKLLRVNRAIQSEGVFAFIKENLGFRRFLLRGTQNVEAEWLLFSLALNVLRMHHKIQNSRLGSGLVIPASFQAGF